METEEKTSPSTKEEEYENEEKALIRLADLSSNDFYTNKDWTKSFSRLEKEPTKITWFIPAIKNPLAGGIRTVFEIANYVQVQNLFVIDDIKDKVDSIYIAELTATLAKTYPKMTFRVISLSREGDIKSIPKADVGVATLWTTAYLLAKYNNCLKKMYLVQDFEPLFYPAGSLSGIIEQTYRLGFHHICNTPEVEKEVNRFSQQTMHFIPSVNTSIFKPGEKPKDYTQVVFYGRKNPRNGFFLGIEILIKLKKKLGDKVRIISVGEDWTDTYPGYLDLGIECAGRLGSLEEVAKLYGESHFGLCFMMTPHPSYQPLEYIASGCIPLTNRTMYREHSEWLLEAERKCLELPMIPEVAVDKIKRLISDTTLREGIYADMMRHRESLERQEPLKEIARYIRL